MANFKITTTVPKTSLTTRGVAEWLLTLSAASDVTLILGSEETALC
jgi:hypothetical protein